MKLLAVAGLLLAAGVALSGCGRTSTSAPAPDQRPPKTSSSTSADRLPSAPLELGTAGSDGLTVRYQDSDGQTRTLRVEDFRR